MRGHIWLGTLSVPFLLFHSGFAWGGTISGMLWSCILAVVCSGLLTLLLQQILPTLLWRSTPSETLEGQSSWQRQRLLMIADIRLCHLCGHQCEGPAAELYVPCQRLVTEYDLICRNVTGRSEQIAHQMRLLRAVLPIEVKEFFWSLAKFTKTELRIITMEAEFPNLLAVTYPALRNIQDSRSAAGQSDTGAAAPVITSHPVNAAKPSAQSAHASSEEREQLWTFYTGFVRPFLSANGSVRDSRGQMLPTETDLHRLFQRQQLSLPESLQGPLSELNRLCTSRRGMDRQRRFLGWMNLCMLLHVPISIMLIVFLIAHIVMSLRVVPF
jgi:hypothetical protein